MYLKDLVGQKSIIMQIKAIISGLSKWNILLRGQYGCGKTILAVSVAAICGMFTYQVPINGNINLNNNVAVQVIDECHQLRNFENLYQTMDNNNFIFCSNMTAKLPEPFISRCFEFVIGDYSLQEMTDIVLLHSDGQVTPDVAQYIAKRSKATPRLSVNLLQRYITLCKYKHTPINLATAITVFGIFGIDDQGLDTVDRQILSLVKTPKSRNTLISALNIDQGDYDRRERFLIHIGLLQITNKGRVTNG